MQQIHVVRKVLWAAILTSFMPCALLAQDNSTIGDNANPASASDGAHTKTLQQVVVTGVATHGGVRKIDASYSVVTATALQIKESNAKSAADFLKMSPGVYPESSGGQTGANIQIAGFPGTSDSPYVTFQLNGSPLYPTSTLSFMDNSSMFRLDDTIERAELVQGGPAVLYGTGQPGLTANFILKEGTDTSTGDVGVTYGAEGMKRLDGFFGFKLATDWYGSFGGFWRSSDGVRDPQFDADKGGSFTATLTHTIDHGSLMFYVRDLKDDNQFVTDTPIINAKRGQFSNYPGFNALTGTFGSKADQHATIYTQPCFTAGCTPGGEVALNLAKGRGADVHMAGGNIDLDWGNGFSLSDKINLTGGEMNTTSYFGTGTNPLTLSAYINGAEAANGLTGVPAIATYTNGSGIAATNQNVSVQGLWYVRKRIRSVSNELHVSKKLFDGNTLTLGNYTTVYGDHDRWFLGNQQLLQAKNNPTPIAVTLANGDMLTDPQGFTTGTTTALQQKWNATNTAFFLTDSWTLGRWLFDAGIREEHQNANGRIQNVANGDLDANAATLYNNHAQYLVAGNRAVDYSKTAPSWTVGANYEIDNHTSAYVRINHGIHFASFDDLRSNASAPVQKIHNMELGFKYQTPWIYADVSAYRRLFQGVPYTQTLSDGSQQAYLFGSATKGINLTTILTPFEHATLAFTGDYLKGHYTHYNVCLNIVGQDGISRCETISGSTLAHQPTFQGRVTPAYDVPMPWGDLKLWATWEYVGNRYGSLLDQQPLGQYHDLAFGVTANIGAQWVLSLQGTNLTNEIGITEGNARVLGFASGSGVILARSIEGREVNFQIKYNF